MKVSSSKVGETVDIGKEKRIHALLTSVMKNERKVNRNRSRKNVKKISKPKVFACYKCCACLKVPFYDAISIKCLYTFHFKLKVNSARELCSAPKEKLEDFFLA
jgi:hypothetical protein